MITDEGFERSKALRRYAIRVCQLEPSVIYQDKHIDKEKNRTRRYLRLKFQGSVEEKPLSEFLDFARALVGKENVRIYKPRFYSFGIAITLWKE